jgi:hypothetical protein
MYMGRAIDLGGVVKLRRAALAAHFANECDSMPRTTEPDHEAYARQPDTRINEMKK